MHTLLKKQSYYTIIAICCVLISLALAYWIDFKCVITALSVTAIYIAITYFKGQYSSKSKTSSNHPAILAQLCEVADSIGISANPGDILSEIGSTIIDNTQYKVCIACTIDNANGQLKSAAICDSSNSDVKIISDLNIHYFSNDVLSNCISSRKPIECDVSDIHSLIQTMLPENIKHISLIPCVRRSKTLAILLLCSDSVINRTDNPIIDAIAIITAGAIQAQESRAFLKENLKKICFLSEVVSKLGPQARMDEVKEAIINASSLALDTNFVALFTIDSMTGQIECCSNEQVNDDIRASFLDTYGYLVTDRDYDGSWLKNDVSKTEYDSAYQVFNKYGLHDILAYPIKSQAGASGLLVAFYKESSSRNDHLYEIIEAISGQASSLMSYSMTVDQSRYLLDDLAGANQELSMQATKDGLTGLANHRTFQMTLSEMCRHACAGSGRVFSLVMIDVDHFKSYNDTYGHQEGDSVLRKVAKVMNATLRQGDLAARYGGEEFCLILRGVSKFDALKIADRVRQAISEQRCGKCAITVSMGIAECTSDASTPGELIEKADRALYHAKVTGRNRVVLWGSSSDSSNEDECDNIDSEQNKRTVLIVERADEDSAGVVQAALSDKTYTTQTANTLTEATELLRTRAFDITFVSKEALIDRSVKSLSVLSSIYPNMPIVLISDHLSSEESKEALRRGASEILLKPYNPTEASMIIERTIERQRIERRKLSEKSSGLMLQAIEALVAAIDAKDPYTAGHSIRVTSLSLAIGDYLHISNEERYALDLAAKLHDIGKLALPDSALNKQSPLTEAEWNAMREHPAQGSKIVGAIDELAYVSTIVRHHHERLDGTGYPDCLRGLAIPYLSRIIAVADSYEAMTSQRAHRSMLTPSEAIEELKRHTGTHYSSEIVQALEQYLIECGEIADPESTNMCAA